MSDNLGNFIRSLNDDVIRAMESADSDPSNPQYRLGIRKLAKAFFDKCELFEVNDILPEFNIVDVDSWYSGKQPLQDTQ